MFSGYALERFFYWKFAEETTYTKMGAWWNRKGDEEIDLVCEDELNETIDFYEIEHDIKRFNPAMSVAIVLQDGVCYNTPERRRYDVSLYDFTG